MSEWVVEQIVHFEPIAGTPDGPDRRNDSPEIEPLRLLVPAVGGMDDDRGHLFVPVDLADDSGDLVVMRRA